MKNPLLRYIVSTVFSITFALLISGVILAACQLLLGPVTSIVFALTAILAVFIASAYSVMLTQNKFNGPALITAFVIGGITTLWTAHMESIPLSLTAALFVTATVGFFATLIFKKPQTYLWYGPLINAIHVFQSFIAIVIVAYSLFVPWTRPVILLLGISVLIIWNPRLMDGCPLTRLEDETYEARYGHKKYGERGFISYYVGKLTGLKRGKNTYENAMYYITGTYFIFFLLGLVFHF